MQQEKEFTEFMYRLATEQSLTFEEAAERLRQNAYTRSVRETLEKYGGPSAGGGTKALQKYITDALMEDGPLQASRDSVNKKVRMWMKDDMVSISKESAIQLSFALKLSVEEANGFLCRVCGEGFHWRSPRELVFLFALREGMKYRQALALCGEMEEKGLLARKTGNAQILTEVIRKDAGRLDSAAALEEYLRRMQDSLGTLHNTAYELFRGYMALLASPKTYDLLEPAQIMSVREITDLYLYEKLIPRMKKKDTEKKGSEKKSPEKKGGKSPEGEKAPDTQDIVLNALQRDIRQNWPDEIMLSKMMNRKADVSRKALILLFLATDGDTENDVEKEAGVLSGYDFMESESGRYEELADEAAEDMYARLNTMLADCGFAPLDVRSPFDWMVLYCICGGENFYIDGRIRQFLTEVFLSAGQNDENGT